MKTELSYSSFLFNYVLKPIKSGVLGFISFLTILVLTKLTSVFIGTISTFTLEIDDLILSSIGFILLFLIRLLENFRDKEDRKFP